MLKMILSFTLTLLIFLGLVYAQQEEQDYSLLERSQVPEELRWKIEDIYPDYQKWQEDFDFLKKAVADLPQKSAGWIDAADKMLQFEQFLSEINQKIGKLYAYASHQYNVEMTEVRHQQKLAEIQMLAVDFSAKLAFIQEDILKLGEEKFNQYLKEEPRLEVYRFGVEKIFRMRPHILPREIQEVVSLTRLFTGHPSQANTLLNDLEIPPAEVTLTNGIKVTLNTANYIRYRGVANAADRSLVMRTFWQNHQKFEKTQAVLFDAVAKQHLFRAKVHKYQDCLEAVLKANDISREVYFNLIKAVRANLHLLHRYLRLKRDLLKLSVFKYDDIYASAVPAVEKYFSYSEARKVISEALKPLGREYFDALQAAFNNRWIDVYPNKGKQSGAYSGSVYGVHPYIKMNYNGKYSSLSTLAHELGHALHSYFSEKYQPYELADYPIFLAEIASTFNENMLLNYLLKKEKDDLFRLYLLDNFLENFRGTVFRQTLFAEFELAMHQQVEQGKSLTADWLNRKYLQLVRDYYGHDRGVVQVDDYIQNEWSGIPHFFMNFYVYQYSTGLIASLALSDLTLTQKNGARNYLNNFLKAGGSDFPLNILQRAGVDMRTDIPAQSAFKKFAEYIQEMEKIVSRLQKKKR